MDVQNALKDLPVNEFRSSSAFVMVLNGKIPAETKNWLITVLKDHHLELSIVSDLDGIDSNNDITLLVSCSEKILQENAKIVYKQLQRQCFSDNESADPSNQLNHAEQQRILFDHIQKICSNNRTYIVGMSDIILYPGQSLIEICCLKNVILHYFPLHDYDHLKILRQNTCAMFGNNIDYIRNYFGEMIGFYFAFLNNYRNMFAWTSFLYLTCLLSGIPNELYILILCFVPFVFIKMWKRYSNLLALNFGTIDMVALAKARPAFRSKGMHIDSITGQLVPYYPITKTWCKEYFISVPFVIICLCLSLELMYVYFKCEDWMMSYYTENPNYITMALTYMPAILYGLIISILNYLYIMAATKLNDNENHKTQESHENHLIVKLVLFEFFNNYISLFYIAFYMKDMEMLKYSLITMLTVNKTVENLIELFIPMYMIHRKYPLNTKSKLPWQQQILQEKYLFCYEHTYQDCLELFIQFGYAFLFVTIWPWAPLVAYINSFLEVRMDAIKLCYCSRRPFQKSTKSINNAWIISFEVLAIIIVISNFLVLSIVSDYVKILSIYFQLSNFELIVYAEHIFLTLVLMFWYIVPDIPKEVNAKLTKLKYFRIMEMENKKFQ